MRKIYFYSALAGLLVGAASSLCAFSGTEAASFLDIPVGARPAALGNAYIAEAADAYAPIYNPGGLGLLQTTQLSGMHISYLDSINYEYATFVHPLSIGNSIGVGVQYFNPGHTAGTDNSGNPTGEFSGHYGSYALSYGHHIGDYWGIGASAKMIDANISGTSAQAYGADVGTIFRPNNELSFAGVVDNIGSKMKFVNQSDSLPLTYHLGASYIPVKAWLLSAEGVYENSGLPSLHAGIEWNPLDVVSLRTGYRTDTTRQLSAMAGFTLGAGLHVFGQEFDYAWLPMGDLGNTQYFSLVLRFSQADRAKRNLIYLPHDRRSQEVNADNGMVDPPLPDLDAAPTNSQTQGAAGTTAPAAAPATPPAQ